MNKFNVKEFMEELKNQEERLLSETRRRQGEEELLQKELSERKELEKLNKLKDDETELADKLCNAKKRKLQLETEAVSWDAVLKSKIQELKEMEQALDESHEKIWEKRDEFCSRVDLFLDDFSKLIRKNISRNRGNGEEIAKEANALAELLSAEEEMGDNLEKELQELREEESKLLDEPNGLEFMGLRERIERTSERCRELEILIQENRKIRDFVPDEKNQLFSILKLEDVKKFSQFRSDR